jgi:membrane glycosyltransferase
MQPVNTIPHLTPSRLHKRRSTFFSLVVLTTVVGVWLLADFLRWTSNKLFGMEWAMLVVFTPLFYQLATGFWLAIIGLQVSRKKEGDPMNLENSLKPEDSDRPIDGTTAIIMPVYNEDVTRVFEGLRVIYQSLEKTGQLKNFDFFVLSDSDSPNKWVEEEIAWLELCRQLNAFGKIFYRKRRKPINRKSGNVSDFCRRWGKKYRYMLVLDADSIMSGELIVKMTRIMEKHPALGILQTAPRTFGAESLFGRIMQFASAFYGGPFMSGLNYMQMGDATFWGHNAIIRLQPFIDYCALPELPGKEPFGGRILSHDFVEAALMRKAGYYVFLLPVDEGSYEEGPPTLIDTLKRDRRWCQGNMQHIWLLFARGWKPISRLNFLHGILSYVSSLLWFAFLLLATILAGAPNDSQGQSRPSGLVLLGITIIMLFLPKICIMVREMSRADVQREYGGKWRVLGACLFDTVYFSVLAPILMWFHSKFVLYSLAGRGVKWAAQRRKSDGGVDWQESIQNFWFATLVALIWLGIALWLKPSFFFWVMPVLGSIALSIPFSIWSSGEHMKETLFQTREEIDPPFVIRQLQENMSKAYIRSKPLTRLADHHGLLQAVLDPYINALHVGLLRQRQRATPENRDYLNEVRQKLLREGPTALNAREAKALMYDADNMLRLHYDLWGSTTQELHPWWDLAIRQYNILTYEPTTPLYR